MAGLNENDILEITVVGRIFGQQTRNVFHYRVLAPSTAITYLAAAQAVANDFEAGTDTPGSALLAACSSEWTWDVTRVQRIWPTRDMYVESLVDLPGTNGTCTQCNLSAVITKRGGLANRHNIGATHVAGIPSAAQLDGEFTGAYKTVLQTLANRFTQLFQVPLETVEARMVIYNRTMPGSSAQVEASTVQPQIRVMRRRTVGLGI